MTNHEMAASYLAVAEEILLEAERLCGRRVWSLTVRRSQETAELALKGALRAVGVEVPRLHDVGVLLKEHRGSFPDQFRGKIDRIASISRRLRREREISLYGDEETGATPQMLYTEEDARAALADARFVLESCRDLVADRGAVDRT
jgi:HEPN domain-containing protein